MTPHLNALEIAGMRADTLGTVLDHTCNVQRETKGAVDTHNHPTPGTWATITGLAGVACHYWEEVEDEMIGEPNATVGRQRVLLPPNVDVRPADRVMAVIGYDGSAIATNLDIKEVLFRPYDTLLKVRTIE